jgi:transcriptional regulator of heat shock response
MEISERQKEILNGIVETYIKTAEPVGSKFLEEKYKFGICPASIRIEMQKLTDQGFLFQPHTSAGRVPADKGYRFFVNNILEKEFFEKDFNFNIEKEIISDAIKFIQSATKNLAEISSNLVLGYLSQEKIFWKNGWEKIIKEPEFGKEKTIDDFIGMIEGLEEEIGGLEIDSGINIYIGKENPFSKAEEFSTIITGCCFSKKENGILAIIGPKRMDYSKNIVSLNFLIKHLEKI